MIIYLITGGEIYGTGGLEKYVLELANYLPTRDIDAKVICRMGKTYELGQSVDQVGEAQWDDRANSRFHMLNHLPNPLTVFLSVLTILNDLKARKHQQKIVHAHDISSSFFVALFISKTLRLPLIVQIHGFPLKEQYIKVAKDSHRFSGFLWFVTKACHHIALKLMVHVSPIVLVNNHEVKYFYERYGVRSEKLKVISAAIDVKKCQAELLPKEEARSYLKISDSKNEFVIGYIGGLRPEKNVIMLIKAFSKLVAENPELKASLVIIGDGPMRPSLEKLVDKLNLRGYVTFKGLIPDAYRLLNAIDIFVLPSLSEGSPLCLLEAMASSKSIAASNIPAISEIVENEQDALLFNPNEPEQLTAALLELCQNQTLRIKLGKNALKKSADYDVEIVFQKIIRVYEKISK